MLAVTLVTVNVAQRSSTTFDANNAWTNEVYSQRCSTMLYDPDSNDARGPPIFRANDRRSQRSLTILDASDAQGQLWPLSTMLHDLPRSSTSTIPDFNDASGQRWLLSLVPNNTQRSYIEASRRECPFWSPLPYIWSRSFIRGCTYRGQPGAVQQNTCTRSRIHGETHR